ncbi:MAG: glycoside hydrolase family 127 protein, partial [bacterium]|nr:glycoside hydrolase family 127 protein [bacterium]
YSTTCCPPNLQRVLASLPGYFYSTSNDGLYVHLYDNNVLDWKLEDGTGIELTQASKYPWEGTVEITVEPAAAKEFTVFLRIPGWSSKTSVAVNGQPARGARPGEYLAMRRTWKPSDKIRLEFDVRPRLMAANPLVRENAQRVAVERGPLVYTMEGIDQSGIPSLFNAELVLNGGGFSEEYRSDLLGGVLVLKHPGRVARSPYAELPLYAPLNASAGRQYRDVELV